MPALQVHGQIAHFSINADDLDRAKSFYANVFGWSYEPYGPPGFFMVSFPKPDPAPMLGSIQGRRELVKGVRMTGFECTITVSDVEDTVRRIEANGGTIVMAKTTLPGVGHLIFFQDPEGNLAGAMQYDTEAR
jgi:predicted enzyme related to lactoylglutathione lyase